jgi:hypothetical protein
MIVHEINVCWEAVIEVWGLPLVHHRGGIR